MKRIAIPITVSIFFPPTILFNFEREFSFLVSVWLIISRLQIRFLKYFISCFCSFEKYRIRTLLIWKTRTANRETTTKKSLIGMMKAIWMWFIEQVATRIVLLKWISEIRSCSNYLECWYIRNQLLSMYVIYKFIVLTNNTQFMSFEWTINHTLLRLWIASQPTRTPVHYISFGLTQLRGFTFLLEILQPYIKLRIYIHIGLWRKLSWHGKLNSN